MFNKILDSCKYVTENAEHVRINKDKINELVKNIKNVDGTHWLQKSTYGLLDLSIEEIVDFLLLYHSIGFSYWGDPKWSIKTEYGDLDGAYAMIFVLIKEIKCNPQFLKPTYLQRLSLTELRTILKGNVEIPLLQERYSNIINMAKSINDNMNGSFYNYIKQVHNDEELLQPQDSNGDISCPSCKKGLCNFFSSISVNKFIKTVSYCII
jgi:hypothetical protein